MRPLPLLAALAACGTTSAPVEPTWEGVTVSTLLPNALAAEISVPGSEAIDVLCQATDEPDDVLVASGDSGAVVVAGLRSDTDYDCEVGTADQVLHVPVRVTLDLVPPPVELVEAGDGPWSALVLQRGAERSAWVLDPLGRPRWVVELEADPSTDPSSGWFVEPRGDTLLAGGGRAFLPRTLDRGGRVVTAFPPPVSGDGVHHDATFVDGGLLQLTFSEEVDGELVWDGFGVEQVADGARSATWSWTSRDAVDAGELPAPVHDDPFHANAVRPDPDGRTVWVSLRNRSELVHLDPATGEVIERIGAGAEITLPAGEAFLNQHDPTFVEDRVLLYDNGNAGRKWSRILELRLPDGHGEAQVLRTFTEQGWYEPVMGGVQALDDGRWFVTRAHCDGQHCAGNDPDARTELMLVDPDRGAVDWRLRFTAIQSIYRARAVDPCTFLGAC